MVLEDLVAIRNLVQLAVTNLVVLYNLVQMVLAMLEVPVMLVVVKKVDSIVHSIVLVLVLVHQG